MTFSLTKFVIHTITICVMMFLEKGKNILNLTETFKIYKMILWSRYDSALLYDSVEALRIIYGDLRPSVTNVVYTNGQMDMWFPRGVTESYPGGEAINIPCKQ